MMTRLRKYRFEIAMVVVAGIAYSVAAENEAFEAFYDFSRSHEDWDLDEIILIYAIAAIVLPVFLFRANRRLKRAMQETLAAEERAQHISRHDPLTGLFNRRHFVENLEQAIADAASGAAPAVLVLDLDRFKSVNDLRGHDAGDRVLIAASACLAECCEPDQIVARLGGDEFAILIPNDEDLRHATGLARRILTAFETPFEIDGNRISLGTSIGISHWTEKIGSLHLLRNADQAMYGAKSLGRGRYALFDEDMGTALQQQAVLEAELRAAIQERSVTPVFQPIVEISSNEIRGFEVLSRWVSPTLGPITPAVFIELAEDMGLIGQLTWQVMEKALEVAKTLDDNLFIAFNFSPRIFNAELLERVKCQLAASQVDPSRVEIELTESAVIHDFESAREALHDLKALGVRISLDDFGTGFSSLATLSKLPFDKIKIDKSFITDVGDAPQNTKIVNAILALAESLQLNVTAEGIETDLELAFLQDRNCPEGQGYLFAKPVDAQTASTLVARSKTLLRPEEVDVAADLEDRMRRAI